MWELDYKESWTPKNWCFWTVVLEKTIERSLDCRKIQPVHSKGDQSWVFTGRTDVEAETPILWPPDAKSWLIWKKPWCWERLKAGGEGDNRGWDGWMASPTQWTWVWVNSGSWWWTGRPGVLRFLGLRRVRHDWAIELNWIIVQIYKNAAGRPLRIWFQTHLCLTENLNFLLWIIPDPRTPLVIFRTIHASCNLRSQGLPL